MSTNNVNITPQSLFDAGNDFAAAFPAAATGDVEEGTTAAAAPPAAAAAAAAAADDSMMMSKWEFHRQPQTHDCRNSMPTYHPITSSALNEKLKHLRIGSTCTLHSYYILI
mmetsp:Transcript_37253/g.76018  ORF Transcript_37253/g.76018 Transcript_37253/m.76018 type:complete len:111 (-) Transcript_37253:1575-1907(-)